MHREYVMVSSALTHTLTPVIKRNKKQQQRYNSKSI